MNKLAVFLGLCFIAAVQAKHEFTKTAKDCMKELGTDETTLEPLLLTKTGLLDENNDLLKKFMGCCFKTFLTDTNELLLDDKLTTYVTEVFTAKLGGKRKLAGLMAFDCLKKCKDVKEDTKDLTAIKTMNCLMKHFHELKDE